MEQYSVVAQTVAIVSLFLAFMASHANYLNGGGFSITIRNQKVFEGQRVLLLLSWLGASVSAPFVGHIGAVALGAAQALAWWYHARIGLHYGLYGDGSSDRYMDTIYGTATAITCVSLWLTGCMCAPFAVAGVIFLGPLTRWMTKQCYLW